MSEATDSGSDAAGWSPVPRGFVLLAVGWLVWLIGLARGAWIDAQFVGPADDVHDTLSRGAYIAQRIVVFDAVAIAFELAAVVVLLNARQMSWWQAVAWVLLALTLLLHGLVGLIHLIFAL